MPVKAGKHSMFYFNMTECFPANKNMNQLNFVQMVKGDIYEQRKAQNQGRNAIAMQIAQELLDNEVLLKIIFHMIQMHC